MTPLLEELEDLKQQVSRFNDANVDHFLSENSSPSSLTGMSEDMDEDISEYLKKRKPKHGHDHAKDQEAQAADAFIQGLEDRSKKFNVTADAITVPIPPPPPRMPHEGHL